MKRTRWLLILVGVLAMVIVGGQVCLAQKILKIGAMDSLTGPMAPGEGLIHQGVVLAVDYLNEKGGIKVKGEKYKIELVTEDTKSSGEGMIAAANKLVMEQNIKFLVGGIMTEMNLAANSVTVPAGVLHNRHYICLAPDELGPNAPQVFSQSPGIVAGMRIAFAHLKEKYPQAKTMAFIWPADGGEPHRQKYLKMVADEFGFKVVYTGSFPNDTTDFNPVVTKALEAKADIFSPMDGWPYHIGSIIKASRAMGYKGPLFNVTPSSILDIFDAAGGGQEVEGFFLASYYLLDPKLPPIMAEIVKRGKAKFGKTFHWHAFGFNTLWVLAQAIESAQSLDPAVVAKHWRTMKTIQTVTGPGKMGGQKTFGINNVIGQPMAVAQIIKGKPENVKWYGNNHTP
ncbi:MAG: ABC transporter substrate-binding protein [Deltaproteobacteria bacterium]|nr:ABC transporter substrate-binding protein [Deltaproteobacteria bacterium]